MNAWTDPTPPCGCQVCRSERVLRVLEPKAGRLEMVVVWSMLIASSIFVWVAALIGINGGLR
jgi:hypothetical protein